MLPVPRLALRLCCLLGLSGGAVCSAERIGPVDLECSLDQGPWHPCQMRVQQVGELWQLQFSDELIRFQHDGQGHVRMRRGVRDWITVQPLWREDSALCWDGVCARGELPLD